MLRVIFTCLALSLAGGCNILDSVNTISGPAPSAASVIIDRFGPTDSVTVDPAGVRVGGYFDFSPYDKISINFSAQKLNADSLSERVKVRVGPNTYFYDSLLSPQKNISIAVIPSKVSKSGFAALTFYAPDSGGLLLLSHLRVIGWLKY